MSRHLHLGSDPEELPGNPIVSRTTGNFGEDPVSFEVKKKVVVEKKVNPEKEAEDSEKAKAERKAERKAKRLAEEKEKRSAELARYASLSLEDMEREDRKAGRERRARGEYIRGPKAQNPKMLEPSTKKEINTSEDPVQERKKFVFIKRKT